MQLTIYIYIYVYVYIYILLYHAVVFRIGFVLQQPPVSPVMAALAPWQLSIYGNSHQADFLLIYTIRINTVKRFTAGAKPRVSAGPLYEPLGIIQVNDGINNYLAAGFICTHIVLTCMTPQLLSSYFVRNCISSLSHLLPLILVKRNRV